MQLVTEAAVAERDNGEIYPCVQLNVTQDDGSNIPFSLDPDTAELVGMRLIKAAQMAKADYNVCRLVRVMSGGLASTVDMANAMNAYRRLREEGVEG